MKLVIVGGVAGGASVATRFRRLNEKAEIIMFEKGPVVSFSNCGLPYHIGGHIKNEEDLVLMTPEKFLAQYNINARVNSEVMSIDKENKTVEVKNHTTGEVYTQEYDKLVLSPGAQAVVPPFKGLDLVNYSVLKTVADVSKIMKIVNTGVKKAVVIGGGFIGVEAAENLAERGIDVTLVEGTKQVIAPLDPEMASFLHNELTKHSVKLELDKFVDHFEENQVYLADGTKIDADLVVMAVGVRPDTDFIKSSGIDMTDRGYINVDETYKTSDDNIYAAGDAILVNFSLTNELAPLALAGPANKQGRLIADAIMGRKFINKGYIGSSAIKVFDLNAASTGLNEKQLTNLDINYMVAVAAPTDKVSIMPGVSSMMTKLIFNADNGKILGAQAVGRGTVDKRIDVIATAIKGGMDIYNLADLELTYAPPFSTGKDVVNKMGYISQSLFEKDHEQVMFTRAYELVKEDAQIIDVREVNEFEQGHINGAVNIPMSTIRHNLEAIDKTKKVYVHCKSGQRSYNVALMLKQKGFDVVNIAGGYSMMNAYETDQTRMDNSRTNIFSK